MVVSQGVERVFGKPQFRQRRSSTEQWITPKRSLCYFLFVAFLERSLGRFSFILIAKLGAPIAFVTVRRSKRPFLNRLVSPLGQVR